MNKPFKIIFKYKNSNGSIQYNPYIFIGNVSTGINSVLNKFTKIPFISTLKNLSKSDLKQLTTFYGEYWYKYFFIYNHLEYSIKNISSSDKKSIQSKLGKDWISKHLNISNIQTGGGEEDDPTDIPENKDNIIEDNDEGDLYDDEDQEKNEELEQEGNVKSLKSKQKQNKVIESLIKKTNIKDKKSISSIINFDTTKNSNFKNEELHNVYNKIYIKFHYIYDDDDILLIKKKNMRKYLK